MFIIVKYGKNESLLCNPSCAVVNLLNSIKKRAGYGNTGVILDLSDETGLVKDLDLHKNEYATKFLDSHTTYILVQKEVVQDNELSPGDRSSTPTPTFQYMPLLEEYAKQFPNYHVHVQEVEKKKTRRTGSKSPSPAGRLRSQRTSKRTSRKK
ncbi:uncharacterized protein CXorf65 homolog [Haliotis cracherodii]|uniref:uncharacterized protein CXorf65 homolog n=1 Tax=Haliotis cracherodii TaxID=6455 RepID=UPI0039EAA463